jgi:hypothetical protein
MEVVLIVVRGCPDRDEDNIIPHNNPEITISGTLTE